MVFIQQFKAEYEDNIKCIERVLKFYSNSDQDILREDNENAAISGDYTNHFLHTIAQRQPISWTIILFK